MRAPAVVAIGGGHGLAASLRAIRTYAGSITAVVSVADDGGSSGRLRVDRPTLPAPGDVRRCVSALGAEGSRLARTLEHRFDHRVRALQGHAFGNLLLAALTEELGSFPAAVDEVARLVGAVGRVLPATDAPVALVATVDSSVATGVGLSVASGVGPSVDAAGPAVGGPVEVRGQVRIQGSSGICRLGLCPADAASSPDVAGAIAGADQVVIGPGSLFTSVLAAAIAPDVVGALRRTRARCIYVANLCAQVPETEGRTLEGHVEALLDHGIRVDEVLCDTATAGNEGWTARSAMAAGVPVTVAPLAGAGRLVHDPRLLGTALAALV